MIAESERREESSVPLNICHSKEKLINYRLNLCF